MNLAAAMVIFFNSRLRGGNANFTGSEIGCWKFFICDRFQLLGIISAIPYFVLVMILVTIAGMIYFPVQQSLPALIAPEEMRAPYIVVGMQALSLRPLLGPSLAGLLMDNADPSHLWYFA